MHFLEAARFLNAPVLAGHKANFTLRPGFFGGEGYGQVWWRGENWRSVLPPYTAVYKP